MISIIIPVYNERECLHQLHKEIAEVVSSAGFETEVIFVDDGSTDGSWDVLEEIARNDGRVHGLGFRRNLGKAAALNHGFSAAKGEIFVTLDADLQDDPQEIPKLLKSLDNSFDMVTGWKKIRHDPWHKVVSSRLFNQLIGLLTGLRLHDHNCGIKAFRAEIAREITLYGEMHRFITILAQARGFRVGEVPVNHRPRKHGHSKYGMSRFLKGFLDLLTVRFVTTFGERPLHLFGGAGIVSLLFGFFLLTCLGALWWLGSRPIGNTPLLFLSVALLFLGVNMISLGILAELVIWKFFQHDGLNCRLSTVVKKIGEK